MDDASEQAWLLARHWYTAAENQRSHYDETLQTSWEATGPEERERLYWIAKEVIEAHGWQQSA